MISAGDFKNGITLEIDGNVCQIVEFQHVKPGKGAAFVRTKYKNIITGAVLEKSFRPTEKFRRQESSVWICSICISMARCITSWIMRLLSRSLCQQTPWAML